MVETTDQQHTNTTDDNQPETSRTTTAADTTNTTSSTATATKTTTTGTTVNKKLQVLEQRRIQRNKLTSSLVQVLDDWSMISFLPCNIQDEDSLDHVLLTISHTIQYGENNEIHDTTGDDDDDHDDYDYNDDNDNDN
jgi:Conserved hypothetical ATP binding protein